MSFLKVILDGLFACPHRHMTMPITTRRGHDPYVVCLDCGKAFNYDWKEMRLGAERIN